METGFERGEGTARRADPGTLGSAASEMTQKVRTKAVEGLDTTKGRISEALEKMARSIEDEPPVGGLAAGFIRRGRSYLDSQSADELVDQARGTLRSHPGMVVAGLFLGGFALSRLLRE